MSYGSRQASDIRRVCFSICTKRGPSCACLSVLSELQAINRRSYPPSHRMTRRFRVRCLGGAPSCSGVDIIKFRRMQSVPLGLLMPFACKYRGCNGVEEMRWQIEALNILADEHNSGHPMSIYASLKSMLAFDEPFAQPRRPTLSGRKEVCTLQAYWPC